MIKLSSVGGNRLCLPEFSDQIVQNVSLCFIFYLNLYVILSSLKQAKGSNLKPADRHYVVYHNRSPRNPEIRCCK